MADRSSKSTRASDDTSNRSDPPRPLTKSSCNNTQTIRQNKQRTKRERESERTWTMPVSSLSSSSVSVLPKSAETPARNTVWHTAPPLLAENNRPPKRSQSKYVTGKPYTTMHDTYVL